MNTCKFQDCGKHATSRGYCRRHYQQALDRFEFGTAVCATDGCDRAASAGRGLCGTHYKIAARSGEFTTRLCAPTKPSRSGGSVTAQGYRMRSVGYRGRYEHRIVMEAHLGRELLPHENIHHRNGDRLDNRIQNLELWSRQQPSGQRVTDKLRWAHELIHSYSGTLVQIEYERLEMRRKAHAWKGTVT